MHSKLTTLLGLTLLLGAAGEARAGGYDTPILYSARHLGMGGTAVAYVDEASALFHNPAGLGHVRKLALTASLSPLFGKIKASPDAAARSTTSELTAAPFFLVGGAYRLTDNLTAGLAAYPVASAGATYKYTNGAGKQITDTTKLVFIEISPGLSFNWEDLKIGVGYRVGLVQLDRINGADDVGADKYLFNLVQSGWNFVGFRAGLQYRVLPELSVGLSYRHKTITEVTATEGTFGSRALADNSTKFTLPSRITGGVLVDLAELKIAADVEYGLNSQNVESVVVAQFADAAEGAQPLEIANQFQWTDAVTARFGVEYDITDDVPLRAGYIFDGKTTNKQYPSAFGTPPAPTQVVTLGCGYESGPMEIGLAYAYRFGSTTVTEADTEGAEPCLPCAKEGDYSLNLHGIYLDFTWRFD